MKPFLFKQCWFCADDSVRQVSFVFFLALHKGSEKSQQKGYSDHEYSQYSPAYCLWCRKMSIFGITHKVLIISTINLFTKDKHTNHFQEPAVLESNIGVSCRWNRPFYRKKPPLFERKSMEWSHFQLLSELKDTVLCYADLANRYPSFSISSKTMKMIFIDIVCIATQ